MAVTGPEIIVVLVVVGVLCRLLLPGSGSDHASRRKRGRSGYWICWSCRNSGFGFHVIACPKCGSAID